VPIVTISIITKEISGTNSYRNCSMAFAITDIPLNYLMTKIKGYYHEEIDFLF
jgi:hypothetical protein